MGRREDSGGIYNRGVYSPQLLDHFQHPRHAGEVPQADASAQIENPACGDVLKLTVKFDGERVADIRFLAKGCVPAMACGSAITELVKGRTVADALRIEKEQIVNAVGGLPPASGHAAQLALDTLIALLKRR